MQIEIPEAYKALYVTNAERPVVKIPAKVLREKSASVKKVDKSTDDLIKRLIKIMKEAHGIGIAAPQIGILKRVIIIAPDGNKPIALINPVIKNPEGEQVGQEGCLSIPGLYGDVKRYLKLEVEAYDAKGRKVAYDVEGLAARVVQHEVDHLDGVLFIDKVIPETLHWQDPNTTDEAE